MSEPDDDLVVIWLSW